MSRGCRHSEILGNQPQDKTLRTTTSLAKAGIRFCRRDREDLNRNPHSPPYPSRLNGHLCQAN